MEQTGQSATPPKKKSFFNPTRITFIALFGALAGVLYILNFSLPFAFPGFLEFNFSDVPVLIGTFTLGPVSGVIIVAVKILVKLAIKGTTSQFVGELSDLITGMALAVPAGLIYKKRRTFKGALVAMAAGTLCLVAVALVFNRFILIPFYVSFFWGSWEPLIGMMTPLFPSCTEETFYVFYLWVSVLPFNLMRCIVAIIVTLPVYKRISNLINRTNAKFEPKRGEASAEPGARKARKINIGVIIAFAVIVVVLVLFTLLQFFVFKK